MTHGGRNLWAIPLLFAALAAGARPAPGQPLAYPGQPFGAAQFDLAVEPGDSRAAWVTEGFAIEEARGRVHYPVFSAPWLPRVLGAILGTGGEQAAGSVRVAFLFTGDEPLELTVYTPQPRSIRLVPTPARYPRSERRLLEQWWRAYEAAAQARIRGGDYAPLVDLYLTSMLSRRLRLGPQAAGNPSPPYPIEDPLDAAQLVLGADGVRGDLLRQLSGGQAPRETAARLALPEPVAWNVPGLPDPGPEVDVEPIALRIPPECFYVRFGSFENYLWLDRLRKENAGDLARLVAPGGVNPRLSDRVQRQLALQQSALAEILGPAVIADVALLGRDMFASEGAAIGILFQARGPALAVDLLRQRNEALATERAHGARLETVTIGSREVSLLSTPDNRLRSFYCVDGDFHLVTTSRAIVARFLEVRDGAESLGATREFRHARSILPTSRGDTVFAYLPRAFLQGLASPPYLVELRRRLQAACELELLQLAIWAARAEGRSAESVAELIREGLLPSGFCQRADGSAPVVSADTMVDSLRGARGSFLPIPDVEVTGVSESEAARLQLQLASFADRWKQWDPLLVGVRRSAGGEPGRERILVDAYVTPFEGRRYGWTASLLGAPTCAWIQPAPGDMISIQAVVQGGLFAPQVPEHHLFLGIQDKEPAGDLRGGLLGVLRILQSTPGYLGAWPRPGYLDRLPLRPAAGPPDADGYSSLPLGIWRRQWDAFSALAFDRQLLGEVTPHLEPVSGKSEAQVRIAIGDLSQSRLQPLVHQLSYRRVRQASIGNARLLHGLSQQLGLPRSEALAAAERVLGAELVCTLGGEYQLADGNDGSMPIWSSTGWPPALTAETPADYRAPLLEWFRGLRAELTVQGDRLFARAEIEMQRQPGSDGIQLPSFLFGGK